MLTLILHLGFGQLYSILAQFYELLRCNLFTILLCSCLLIFLGALRLMSQARTVYLVDYACYKPEPTRRMTREVFMDRTAKVGWFTKENVKFQRKITEKAGLGQETYVPEALIKEPPELSMAAARAETEAVVLGAIDEVLEKTGVKAEEIEIVVVNCSSFNPMPSLGAMIMNHYKLRHDTISYNLAGMGCSAGLISIDLANHLLQVHRNTCILIVSTENITSNLYSGNNRSMLISNCLFRMGGAAILLSNRPLDHCRSKYQLLHTVRTHMGADDFSYSSIFQQEDENNTIGVSLSKDLVAVAGKALKANFTTLGLLVFPMSEQLLFFANLLARKLFKTKNLNPYIPDFKMAFQHFCIHAGGRAILDALEKNLKLTQWHIEPSRMTLYRFGNISSSSLWYELAYIEGKGRIRKGDRTWMIGFGSGFKCNSVVWQALRNVDPDKEQNPWMDEIDKFPVHVPVVMPLAC